MHAAAGRDRRLLLEVPADVKQLAGVRAFVRSSAAALGARRQAVDDMVQAVDECLTNSIVHGYAGKSGNLQVELAGAGANLVVKLRDEAPPFDPTMAPVLRFGTPASLPRGGMGIHLARQLTDQMTYRRTKRGNELTLVKGCITGQEEGNADHQG